MLWGQFTTGVFPGVGKQSFRDMIGAASDEMVVGALMCGFRKEGAPAIRAPKKLRPLMEGPSGCGEEEEETRPKFARKVMAARPVLCFVP